MKNKTHFIINKIFYKHIKKNVNMKKKKHIQVTILQCNLNDQFEYLKNSAELVF